MEQLEEEQLELLDSDSSGVLSILTITEDPISASSSGDLYALSGPGSSGSSSGGSSGEVLCTEEATGAIPRLLPAGPAESGEGPAGAMEMGAALAAASRHKCVGRNNKGVAWGFTSIIGRRKEMEDAVAVVPGFMSRACDHVGGCSAPGSRTSGEISPLHFFGVYDGHGGSQRIYLEFLPDQDENELLYLLTLRKLNLTVDIQCSPPGRDLVAKFCAARMHEVIAEEWNREAMDGFEWQRRWEAAFSTGFERADGEVMTAAAAPEMVGSTAVVAILSGCQIMISNCGDSRAILCRGTQTVALTVDQKVSHQTRVTLSHINLISSYEPKKDASQLWGYLSDQPDRHDELMRIEEMGGKVINWNGARVFGVLAMSRAIGDHYLRPWIIPVPEITFTTRRDEDECLILASDGLWDVMTNDEVGEVARRLLRRRRRLMMVDEISPAQAVADYLAERAYGRNSSDNISIIVVDLKAKRKRQQRPQEG